jgi:hypothetical protein
MFTIPLSDDDDDDRPPTEGEKGRRHARMLFSGPKA